MALTIINDSPLASYTDIERDADQRAFCDHLNHQSGIYIGGWSIAPDAYLIRATHFGEAWEALTETMAESGSLNECDHSGLNEEECDSCDWVDGFGPRVTLDVTLRVVRPGRRD